jgi:electron transfer flavoprotein beta subunit
MVPMPAVLTVKEGLNLPRYPSVPGRMRAGRKPVATSPPARPESRLQLIDLVVPGGPGRQTKLLGSGLSAAPAVVEMLRDIGLV